MGWIARQLLRHPRVRTVSVAIASLAGSTIAVALLEQVGHVPYAAPVYLLAVLAVGTQAGTIPAVATAFVSFLLYDFLFVQPLYTFTISDANEWLDLLLLLAVAMATGRLVALQTRRATEAAERAREAIDLFRISRTLATSDDLPSAAQAILVQLVASRAMDRMWLGLGPDPTEERIVADSDAGAPLPVARWHVVLQRQPGDEPARWVRAHVGVRPEATRRGGVAVHRIRVEVPGEVVGSLWGVRHAGSDPDRVQTRLLSAAADQLGGAVRRERLLKEATEAEVVRRSEALKTALLDSVSHDLRTPLATIRAAAGSLLDRGVEWSADEQERVLRTIDTEADRMNRLVRDLLDLSRIEGGALRPELEPYDVDALVERVARRIEPSRAVRVALDADLPPVLVDATYLDESLANLVENAVRYGGPTIAISARALPGEPVVEIVVEDDGVGVPDADLPHLFDKFYRVRRPGEGARHGMGIGLTVAQGLVRAMGGDIGVSRSRLGGLAFRVRLPSVELPMELTSAAAQEPAR